MVKIILRMNLADFILTSFEEDVINKLDEAYKDSIKFYLSLNLMLCLQVILIIHGFQIYITNIMNL